MAKINRNNVERLLKVRFSLPLPWKVTKVTKVPYKTVWLFSAFLPSLAFLKYERLSGLPRGFGLRAEPPDSRRL